VNKAGDALMLRQAEGIEHAAVVGVPFGDPVCPVAERVRGEDKAHGGGAGGEHLLPFRDFHVAKSTSARRSGDPARTEHKNIQHAVRYTEVVPNRLKDFAVEITITRR